MSDDRGFLAEFQAMAEGAFLSGSPSNSVKLETEQSREYLLYSTAEDGQVCGHGTLIVPAATRENQRRWAITRGCPACPGVNQGLMVQEHDLRPEAGTYVTAAYGECGHGATIRLDGDEEPHVFPLEA
jgi:hypothetical protein